MRALILAAGRGTRLRPLTDAVPKPMLVVSGRPILEHNVRLLRNHGITDLAINLHHLPHVVTDYFGDGSKFGVHIEYFFEPELLGTGGAIDRIRGLLLDTSLVIYGDNLITCNLQDLLGRHRRTGAAATLAIAWREEVGASGIVEFDQTGRVRRFEEKPRAGEAFSHWVNAGAIAFEPAVLRYVPHGIHSDLSAEVLPAMLRGGELLQVFEMKSGFWWIDTLADYERTCEDAVLP